MYVIPQVKSRSLESGAVQFHHVCWSLPEGVEKRLADAARELFPEDVHGYTVRLSWEDMPYEAYRLIIQPTGTEIYACSEAGAFYAMQTLGMLHRQGAGTVCCQQISDAPDLPFRGFMLDVTRGRVPTMESLKDIIRQLARYKINTLQIYIENAFLFREMEGIVDKDNCLTSEEFRQLDDWCYANYIELIPTFACFGHLYDLLQAPQYRHLAELEEYTPQYHYWPEKMLHHTLDVYNPDSFALVKSLLDQVFPLFRSSTVNICCDETFDLCRGRNRGKDTAQAYIGFAKMITAYAKFCGKQVQMWADIALKYPTIIPELGGDVTFLNWNYSATPPEKGVRQLAQAGFRQILCPGVQSWNVFVPNIRNAEKNITAMAVYAKKYNAHGLLNTVWGDYGHICSWSGNVYGMIFGAEKSWNCTDVASDEEFRRTVSRMEFGADVDILNIFGEINAHDGFIWQILVCAMSGAELEPWTQESRSLENLQALVQACEDGEKTLAKLDQTNAVSDFLLAVEGTRYAAQMLAGILYGTSGFDPEEMHQWFDRYQRSWLRENKSSELWRIDRFLKDTATMIGAL